MLKRACWLVLTFAVIAGATALIAARGRSTSAMLVPVTVHEWGTFTSVAGPDGGAVDWQPLSGPQDLPCFVTKLNPNSIKSLPVGGWLPTIKARVRMETPVLYFYAPTETTVQVKVRFPQGLITEWYPQGKVPPVVLPLNLPNAGGAIAWNDVKVMPGSAADFPTEAGKSHYYAARETDAAPLLVGSQTEKFLFYRGLAGFSIPISAKVTGGGRITIESTSAHEIGHLILFENNGGRVGYRVERGLRGQITLERPTLTNTFASLRNDLERSLIDQGLYAREAKAMIETWHDSWFEEGTRVFYIVPREALDSILPLEIDPKPIEVSRVFVGRLEIIAPAMQDEVEQAILMSDLDTLDKYGRFLEPIALGISARPSMAADPSRMRAALQAVAASHSKTAACR